MRYHEIIKETVEEWNGKNVVAYRHDYRIVVDSPTDATYVTAWTPDNKKVGFISTRKSPGPIGQQYLSIGLAELTPKHRGKGVGMAMYKALLAHLNPRWKGISSYLPDRSNKRQVPKIWRRLGGYTPQDDFDYVVVDRSSISEGRDMTPKPVLFHGTSIFNLLHILSQDTLRHDLGADELHMGVSLTRSFWIAAKAAEQAEEFTAYSEDFEPPVHGWCAGAVMALGRDLITQHTTLEPVRWDNVSTEQEERTHGSLPHVATSLVSLYVSDRDLDYYDQLATNYDFPVIMKAGLTALRNSPLRRKLAGFPPATRLS